MKILCIGVHPDDIELGIGGTLQKHVSRNDEIEVLILTDGKRDEKGYHISSPERRNESIQGLNHLGVLNVKFFSLKEIVNTPLVMGPIEKEIRSFKPDRIYTHSVHDRHQEHRRCFEMVQSIGRYTREILLFEVYSCTPEFHPTYFIELSEKNLEKKIEAIKFHKSQFKENTLLIDKIISANSIFRAYSNYGGRREFLPLVEAFEVLKIFRIEDRI